MSALRASQTENERKRAQAAAAAKAADDAERAREAEEIQKAVLHQQAIQQAAESGGFAEDDFGSMSVDDIMAAAPGQ